MNGWTVTQCTCTRTASETATVVLYTASYDSEARVTVVGTTYSGYPTTTNDVVTTLSAGTYTLYYEDTWGDGCNPSSWSGTSCWVQVSYTLSTGNDKFQFDSEAWFDTDDDGLTDYIDPNSTIVAYTTVPLCTGDVDNYMDTWYSTSSVSSTHLTLPTNR